MSREGGRGAEASSSVPHFASATSPRLFFVFSSALYLLSFLFLPIFLSLLLGELGYHCTIFPMTLFRRAMRGVMEGLEELREGGRVEGKTLREGRLMTREETYELLGYTPGKEWVYPSANARGKGSGGGGKGGRRSGFVQAGGPGGMKEEEGRGGRRRGEEGEKR